MSGAAGSRSGRTAEDADASVNGAPAAEVRGALPVESVRRALRVLGCFGPGVAELGVTDVAVMLQMHKSTVHRLLLTLEQEGFVRQVAGRYSLTWRVLEIAAGIPVRAGLSATALKHLTTLVADTGETAHLAVLDGGKVLYVEKVTGTHQLRMPSAVGTRVPLHATALGKVLLGGLDEETKERLIAGTELQPITPHTIVDPKVLRRHVKQAVKQGYATDAEEIEQGLMCIAAPIVDQTTGVTCAAISIAGPASRIQARQDHNIQAVRDTAAALSAELGAFASRLSEMSTA